MNEEINNTPNDVNNTTSGFNENMVEPKKKGKAPILIILGLLIILLVAIGVYSYVGKKSNPQNIYYSTIDKLGESIVKAIKETNEDVNKVLSSSVTVTFNLKSNTPSIKEIASLFNKLKITTKVESDMNSQKIYGNLNLLYNNENMAKGELLIKDNSVYANLSELYNRPIKLYEDELLKEIWQNGNTKDYEIIINNMVSIFKKSLKENWFTLTEETIDVLDKKVDVYKHTLKLDGEKMYDFANSMIDGILNDNELLASLANVLSLDIDTIKTKLEEAKQQISVTEGTFESSIYVNKKNDDVEKVEITETINEEELKVNLNKTAEDTFNIVINDNKVGTLSISDDKTNIKIDYDGVNLELNYQEQGNSHDIGLKLSYENDTIEFTIADNDGEGTMKINVTSKEEDIDLTMNISYKENETSKITEFNTNNAILVDEMTEEDVNGILEKLQNNNAFLKLMQDLTNSGINMNM